MVTKRRSLASDVRSPDQPATDSTAVRRHRREPAADVRQRLLSAAVAVLREDGFHALTQTRVAERSGLRQSHLTYYFPRRADLLMAVAETVASQMQAGVSAQSSGRPLDIDGLRAVLHAQLADREVPRLMLALVAAADEDARLGAWLARFHAGIAAMLAAALARAGVEAPVEALALFQATLVGLRVGGLMTGARPTELSSRLDRALDHLLAAAGRDPDRVV